MTLIHSFKKPKQPKKSNNDKPDISPNYNLFKTHKIKLKLT